MFIRKDNTIMWKRVLLSALVTLGLVLGGIFWYDKILHMVMHKPDCNVWTDSEGWLCSVAVIIGRIFDVKIWLAASLVSVLFFFIYKAIRNEFDFRYAFVKIKNSYVFYVFCSVALAIMVTEVIKVLIGRSRPVMYDALGQVFFRPGVVEREFNSMPSGHTAVSFAALVMIGMLFPRMKWATWTLAIVIGLSRIYVGEHWPSDVVFGAFIGMICADIVKSALKKINTK